MKRSDDRTPEEMRRIKIKTNYIKYAEGSCLFEAGDTRVICTASVEKKVPGFLKGQGTGWITSEYGMLPRSCQTRIAREASKGKQGGRTHEIQRLIGRTLRGAVNMDMLGERTIWMDCDVIQADGGTRCASITGSFIALCLALNVLKKQGVFTGQAVRYFIAAVSVGVIDEKNYLDLNYEEDSRAEVDMNIVMTDSGRLIEIQGTAEREPFTKRRMNNMLDLAQGGINDLINKQKTALKGVV
ncbi:MAG: ribonuclease PH [Candidatus Omnitrophota bacterium]